MKNLDEKTLFSERLREALDTLDFPTNKPTWFAREFNSRALNAAISVQTANNWLLGAAIPSQDKLQVISHWLNVTSQWLRFGEEDQVTNFVGVLSDCQVYGRPMPNKIDPSVGTTIQDLPQKIARLTPAQKQAINHVIDVMLSDRAK